MLSSIYSGTADREAWRDGAKQQKRHDPSFSWQPSNTSAVCFRGTKGQVWKDAYTESEEARWNKKCMAPASPAWTGHPTQGTRPWGPGWSSGEGVDKLNCGVWLDGYVQDKSPVVLLSPWVWTKTKSLVLKSVPAPSHILSPHRRADKSTSSHTSQHIFFPGQRSGPPFSAWLLSPLHTNTHCEHSPHHITFVVATKKEKKSWDYEDRGELECARYKVQHQL